MLIGISALYHDSAAALIEDGKVIRAAQEERFSRIKNDRSFPVRALDFCLSDESVKRAGRIDAIVYYDNPFLTCDRFISNCAEIKDLSPALIKKQYPNVFGNRIWIKQRIQEFLERRGLTADRFLVCEHHISHAAGAYFTSGFDDAAILVTDGVGEWKTMSLCVGEGNRISIIKHLDYPHSLGMLYSAFTYFCGFKVNSGEYKLMGLAAYGSPVFEEKILRELVDIKEDGSFRLNMEYFEFQNGHVMTGEKFEELFGCRRRLPDSPEEKVYLDLAASIQSVTELIIIRLARHLKEITGKRRLCMAGGCALNCVANGKLLREGIFDDIYIQPAAGDAGGCVGAALYAYYNSFGNAYEPLGRSDTPYLGPAFDDDEIGKKLEQFGAVFHRYENTKDLLDETAGLISDNRVVGFFQGRMEFGPRALGHRSILANPMWPEAQSRLNLKIKFRESFRPFAPAVLREHAAEYFELDAASPYMLLTAMVRDEHRLETAGDAGDIYSIINQTRSDIPAVTHVDYSARIQTVEREDDELFYELIERFYRRTGCPMVVNTSFNVRGEPIVCSVKDAYACFMNTQMDVLAIGNFLLYKDEQPTSDLERWRADYGTD